jgi:hypothetical protein
MNLQSLVRIMHFIFDSVTFNNNSPEKKTTISYIYFKVNCDSF